MNIKDIKKYLMSKVGSNIIIVYYGSRSKKEIYRGVVHKIYNHLFSIKLNDENIKSFSYVDILTKTLQIYI